MHYLETAYRVSQGDLSVLKNPHLTVGQVSTLMKELYEAPEIPPEEFSLLNAEIPHWVEGKTKKTHDRSYSFECENGDFYPRERPPVNLEPSSFMASTRGRLRYKLVVKLVPNFNIFIAWAKEDSHSYRPFQKAEFTAHLVKKDSRVYLKTPAIVARNISLDLTTLPYNDREFEGIVDLYQLAISLMYTELQDPEARPRDSYISGRHYSSMDLYIDHTSPRIIGNDKYLGFDEMKGSLHGIREEYDYRHIVVSKRGDIAFDGSIITQLLPALADAGIHNIPEGVETLIQALKQ